MKAFYFGCVGHPGHFFYGPDGRHAYSAEIESAGIPWKEWEIDCKLQPGCYHWRDGHWRHGQEIEGAAALHHEDGWTALSMWDRSVDTRGGCNSAFLFEGTFTFEEAIALVREHFPSIVKRLQFEIVQAVAAK